ncbi:hypothetical protein ThidrDRAFT_1157 [Thiorhodococcus drewsii AZ1]|uniref:Uncharacterized protein n=1 Tax=Thiorhodococcus drewsii AZ1 TaxID=765913 RepID=G2DYP5_9GAMM|nr:hypothetical protein [Thiorhodococcus drewsii]EGV32672.1 hypothetical protein ThidrDRAFT_1157 [Thiorhodococcus drewsii AZ1]
MSTTTVSFRSTTRDADLAALRRREAEARQAARQARRHAQEERRREETMRRRMAAASRAISEQETRFQNLVERLDEAAHRLPDLALATPRLTPLSDATARDPDRLESYADRLATEVDECAQVVESAIREAERLLERRLERAAAWRRAADLEQQMDLLRSQIEGAVARIRVEPGLAAPPQRPLPDAELETVQAYEATLKVLQDQARRQLERLQAQISSRETAIVLSGTPTHARTAEQALTEHAAEEHARTVAALRAHLNAELARASLSAQDLPDAMHAQLDAVTTQTSHVDYRSSITRLIARERQRRDGIARALELMQSVPDLAHDDPGLGLRWTSLAAQLQRIASGLEDFSPSVERESAQLHVDARRLVNMAFTRTDWIEGMCAQGFEVLEREEGEGLVVVDLDHPEIWLEATEYETDQGGFAATLEIMTDAAPNSSEDGVVTKDVCARLARAASSKTPNVATESTVIERERRIKRARRPAVARKTFTQCS